MFDGNPWVIDEILDWATPIALDAGFAGVAVGCTPTGHRWRPLLERCRTRGVELVSVNPMLVHRGRAEEEDFTRDRSDFARGGPCTAPTATAGNRSGQQEQSWADSRSELPPEEQWDGGRHEDHESGARQDAGGKASSCHQREGGLPLTVWRIGRASK